MRRRLVDALRWLVFAAAVLAMNFPVLSTLVTSLKSDAEISASACTSGSDNRLLAEAVY